MFAREALVINVLLAVGLILLFYEAPGRRRWAAPRNPAIRLGAILLVNCLSCCYIAWRFQHTLPEFEATPAACWAWLFFACEAATIAYELWSLCVLIRVTNHSPEADRYEQELRRRPDLPTVDVFIPTYSEGPEIVEDTIRGALRLDWPAARLKVWVLDDGRRPWLQELCAQRGVGYFARPSNEHGKAGNLNYALPRTDGEFILIIDADFVLRPNFLYRTLGFLLYRTGVGLVQTPQHFRNPDPVQHNLFGARAWPEEQNFFMTVVESARDAYSNAFCVGSGWLVPRARLRELGGFPQESICEDLEVSYALLARGYRTLFLNERLCQGMAPESVPEYIKQRVRWCTGTIQHLFLRTGPLRARGLSWLDRVFYLEPIVYWLTYPFIVLLLLAPLVFWYTGVPAFHATGDEILLLVVPRFVANYILVYWLSEGKVLPPVTTVHKMLPAFHLAAAVAKALVRPFGQPFKVTLKGQARDRITVQWPLFALFAAVAAAFVIGMLLNYLGLHNPVDLGDMTALNVAWSFYSLLVVLLCALACVEFPKGRDYVNATGEVLHANVVGAIRALLTRFLG